MKIFHAVIGVASLAALTNIAQADEFSTGLAVSAGSLGVGGELEGRFADAPFGLRLGGNALHISHNLSTSDVSYHGTVDLANGGLIADWYPWGSGFRFSLGGKYDGNKVDVTATPTSGGILNLNNTAYSTAGSSVTGRATFDAVAPYAGLGFGGRVVGGLTAGIDLGALYVGSPKVALAGAGPITALPGFSGNLFSEQARLQSKIEDYRFYPVLQLSLGYQF